MITISNSCCQLWMAAFLPYVQRLWKLAKNVDVDVRKRRKGLVQPMLILPIYTVSIRDRWAQCSSGFHTGIKIMFRSRTRNKSKLWIVFIHRYSRILPNKQWVSQLRQALTYFSMMKCKTISSSTWLLTKLPRTQPIQTIVSKMSSPQRFLLISNISPVLSLLFCVFTHLCYSIHLHPWIHSFIQGRVWDNWPREQEVNNLFLAATDPNAWVATAVFDQQGRSEYADILQPDETQRQHSAPHQGPEWQSIWRFLLRRVAHKHPILRQRW